MALLSRPSGTPFETHTVANRDVLNGSKNRDVLNGAKKMHFKKMQIAFFNFFIDKKVLQPATLERAVARRGNRWISYAIFNPYTTVQVCTD